MSDGIYIAGVAETPLGIVPDHTELSMAEVAAREALAEAGMTFADVDGLFTTFVGDESTVQLGEYLGIRPRYADSTDFGGAAFEQYVHHAMLAIEAGRCEVALITFASRQRSRRARRKVLAVDEETVYAQFEAPYGAAMPITYYAMAAARHMHLYGTTSEQLASVAVTASQWAALNPKAFRREPLTVDDVLSSPMISTPLHKLDICLVSDGGGAVVVTTAARARDAAKKPIRVLGVGESQTHWHLSQMPEIGQFSHGPSGRDAFARAGVTPADVDVFEPYDAFTINVIMILEELGFCAPGEAPAFVASGALAPGGSLPGMTSGGGLSYNHPGALGVLLLVEAVRQLRHEAGERQVPDAEVAVAHGIGGVMSTASTVVLGRE